MVQKLDTESEFGIGFDFGIIYKTKNWGVGGSVNNFGTKTKFAQKSYPLPLTLRSGGNYIFNIKKSHNIILSGEIEKPRDDDIRCNIGCEYSFNEIIFLRTGYQIGRKLGAFKFGVGIKYNEFGFDYAMDSYGKLGIRHIIQISTKFM